MVGAEQQSQPPRSGGNLGNGFPRLLGGAPPRAFPEEEILSTCAHGAETVPAKRPESSLASAGGAVSLTPPGTKRRANRYQTSVRRDLGLVWPARPCRASGSSAEGFQASLTSSQAS